MRDNGERLTDEQLLELTTLGSEITACAYFVAGGKDAYSSRIDLAARRIAEIVIPQDLRYVP